MSALGDALQPPCGNCGEAWDAAHGVVCSRVPRVATSLDDLRVGQVVAWETLCDGWMVDTNDQPWSAVAFRECSPIVILSDPPPEPVTVSREAFDRLADAVSGVEEWWHKDAYEAARALVEEVRGADA